MWLAPKYGNISYSVSIYIILGYLSRSINSNIKYTTGNKTILLLYRLLLYCIEKIYFSFTFYIILGLHMFSILFKTKNR